MELFVIALFRIGRFIGKCIHRRYSYDYDIRDD